jgi:hypothetical protein
MMNTVLEGLNSKTLIGNVVVWLLWSFAVSHGFNVPPEAGLIAGGTIGRNNFANEVGACRRLWRRGHGGCDLVEAR